VESPTAARRPLQPPLARVLWCSKVVDEDRKNGFRWSYRKPAGHPTQFPPSSVLKYICPIKHQIPPSEKNRLRCRDSVTDPIRCRSTESGSTAARSTAVGQRHFPFGAQSGIARYNSYFIPKPHPRFPSLPSHLVSPLYPATSTSVAGIGRETRSPAFPSASRSSAKACMGQDEDFFLAKSRPSPYLSEVLCIYLLLQSE
jgi:hypothetical protein